MRGPGFPLPQTSVQTETGQTAREEETGTGRGAEEDGGRGNSPASTGRVQRGTHHVISAGNRTSYLFSSIYNIFCKN